MNREHLASIDTRIVAAARDVNERPGMCRPSHIAFV